MSSRIRRTYLYLGILFVTIVTASFALMPDTNLSNENAYAANRSQPNITQGTCKAKVDYEFKATEPAVAKYNDNTWESSAQGQESASTHLETQVLSDNSNDPRDVTVRVKLAYPATTNYHYLHIPDFLKAPQKFIALRITDGKSKSNESDISRIKFDKLHDLYQKQPSQSWYTLSDQGTPLNEYRQHVIDWNGAYWNNEAGWLYPAPGNQLSSGDWDKLSFAEDSSLKNVSGRMWKPMVIDRNKPEKLRVYWHGDNDNGHDLRTGRQYVIYYYEAKLDANEVFGPTGLTPLPKYAEPSLAKRANTVGFAGIERSNIGNLTNGFAYPRYLKATYLSADLHGYYDSPYLLPGLYNVPKGAELPRGMKLTGHFYDKRTGKTLTNVSVQRGNQCYTYTDGTIDFSGDNLKEIWDNLGQSAGRKYFFNDMTADEYNRADIQFRYDIYADDQFKKEADFNYNGSDRMRIGYLKAEYQGKTVPVKVFYYQEANKWKPQWNVNSFTVRLRPYILVDKDPKYPLNPVAISPYKRLVKWISFDDATVKDELKTGKTIERTVIPGFLRVKCNVKDIKAEQADTRGNWSSSYLDSWAPGFYYQDAAPWMIGDERKIAIHQTGDRNRSTATLECWAVRRDPGLGRDVEVNIPINGFVALDAESTDGLHDANNKNLESLGMHTDDSNGKYYPIYGFSSCHKLMKQMASSSPAGSPNIPDKKWEAVARTERDHIIPTDSNSPVGILFSNDGGRCGEIPFKDSETNLAGTTDYGLTFGPALMMTAPIADFDYHMSEFKKTIKVSMNGLGKQALGFGVIVGADTSNADYNNQMPPVLQYSSLSFHGGQEDPNGKVDWSSPNEFVKNFYYYGSRIGKRAVAYDPNRTDDLKVRDGQHNDGQPSYLVDFKAYPESNSVIEPKIKPINNGPEGSAYITDKPGFYLAGKDTYDLEVGEQGGVMKPSPRAGKPLSVTVPCGKNYKNGDTKIRAWADFNGNGVFDPDEVSSIASCSPQEEPISGNARPFSPELPWTDTAVATVTFPYPTKHDLNGKRNVWMRLRAVSDTDNVTKGDVLDPAKADKRKLAEGWPSEVRTVNPDSDAPDSLLGSAAGSWVLSESGETEDFLFDISTPPYAKDERFCYSANTSSITFDPLKNDRDPKGINRPESDSEADRREPDRSTLVFMKDQDSDNITVSDRGRKAVVKGEGTYTINQQNGMVTFTPESIFKAKLAGLGKNVDFTYLKYAFLTKEGKNTEGITVYDRALAANAKFQGNGGPRCALEVKADTWLNWKGSYTWTINKEVLKGSDTGNTWVKNDERGNSGLKPGDRIPLKYQIKVKTKANKVLANGLKGRLNLYNPESITKDISTFKFYNPDTNGELEGGLVCEIDGGQLPTKIDAGETKDITFTCNKPGATGDLGTLAHKVKIAAKVNGLGEQEIVPSLQRNSGESTTDISSYQVALRDFLYDSRNLSGRSNLGHLPVEVVIGNEKFTANSLRDLKLSGGKLVAAGSNDSANGTGEAVLTMPIPEVNRPQMPEDGTKAILNETRLCLAGDPCVDERVAEMSEKDGRYPDAEPGKPVNEADPKITDRPPVNVVHDSRARVSVSFDEALKTVYLRKLDQNGKQMLKGAQFSLYEDKEGAIGKEKTKVLPPSDPKVTPAEATEFSIAGLKTLVPYWVKEIKAPDGHQLLAEPVRFQVKKDGTVQILSGGSEFVTVVKEGDKALINVQDVEKGHLPASGGRGVIMSLVIGMSLFTSAYCALRRGREKESLT